MTFRRGDVVLVPFPFSDLSTTKVRPAVVVSSALYHATEPDLLLAALTSKIAAATPRKMEKAMIHPQLLCDLFSETYTIIKRQTEGLTHKDSVWQPPLA